MNLPVFFDNYDLLKLNRNNKVNYPKIQNYDNTLKGIQSLNFLSLSITRKSKELRRFLIPTYRSTY